MKRFYRDATAAPDGDAYGITLDGRPLRTPAKRALTLPGLALAEAIAAEWHAQEDQVDSGSMPLMRFASTAIDRVADRPEAVIDEIARYGATDLLCYRADHPPDLVARQRETWQPLLDWARDRFDAALEVTVGVVPLTQPPSAVAALRTAVAVHGPMPRRAVSLSTISSPDRPRKPSRSSSPEATFEAMSTMYSDLRPLNLIFLSPSTPAAHKASGAGKAQYVAPTCPMLRPYVWISSVRSIRATWMLICWPRMARISAS